MKTLEDLELADQPVFMRVDFNVPIEGGAVSSDARIRAAMPSIQHVIERGGRLALASHLGRPKGKRDMRYTLEPVAQRLSELLDAEVRFAEDCVGDGVKGLIRELRSGQVALLENLRFHAGEESNDPDFARRLAAPFSRYINDAFGASHRAHASIVGMARHFGADARAAGYLLGKEAKGLGRLLEEPERPFVAVVGGAKVSDKLGVLDALLGRADVICIGGAMAYTFLRARGVPVGASKVEEDKLRVAGELLERARHRDVRMLLPVDHVGATEFSAAASARYITEEALPAETMGLDIGQSTRKIFLEQLQTAGSIFWNGPMGVFEWEKFSEGTMAIARAIADCTGYTVVGGGDSVAAVEAAGVVDTINHVSTGGGASLEFLEQGSLPGLDVLEGKLD